MVTLSVGYSASSIVIIDPSNWLLTLTTEMAKGLAKGNRVNLLERFDYLQLATRYLVASCVQR